MSFLDSSLLIKAINFAAIKHKTQRRKDAAGTPYINHPIEVAYLISQIGGITDIDILRAAVLHDTLEDTETTWEELWSLFGEVVANMVKEVTDDKSLPKDERKRLQIEHGPSLSRGARIVKLADKLSNLRDLVANPPLGWDQDRIQGYFVWSQFVVNGLRGACKPLEDALDVVFQSVCRIHLKVFPAIPKEVNLAEVLTKYLESMKTATN